MVAIKEGAMKPEPHNIYNSFYFISISSLLTENKRRERKFRIILTMEFELLHTRLRLPHLDYLSTEIFRVCKTMLLSLYVHIHISTYIIENIRSDRTRSSGIRSSSSTVAPIFHASVRHAYREDPR